MTGDVRVQHVLQCGGRRQAMIEPLHMTHAICCLPLQGEAPTGAQSSSVSSILGTASTTQSLAFTNPFDKPVEVEVALSTVEERGTFKLLLPGAHCRAGACL